MLLYSGTASAQPYAVGNEKIPNPATCISLSTDGACYQATGAGNSWYSTDPVTLTITTGNATLFYAKDGGSIALDGGATLRTGNNNSQGFVALTGGTITGTDVSLVFGGQTYGISADSGSTITFNGTTTIADKIYLAARSTLVNANGTNTTITFTGPFNATTINSYIVTATNGAAVAFNGGGIVQGTAPTSYMFGAFGGRITGKDMTVDLTSSIDVNGKATLFSTNFAGGAAGTLDLTNTKMKFRATEPGIVANGFTFESGGPASVSLDNSTLTMGSSGSVIAAYFGAVGAVGTVNLTRGSALVPFDSSAAGSLASVGTPLGGNPATTLVVNATDSTLAGGVLVYAPQLGGPNQASMNLAGATTWTGDLVVDGASIGDVTMTGRAAWTGAATNARNLSVGGDSTWTMTADSSATQLSLSGRGTWEGNGVLTGDVSNGGIVAPGVGPTPGGQLTVNGNYSGNYDATTQTGGKLAIDTQLGDSASRTDQLIVNGGAITGVTGIVVTNRGGAGDTTTGNGIPIVVAQGGATSTANAFILAERAAAGATEYGVRKGASGSADDLNSWYLCNTGGCAIYNPNGGNPNGGPNGGPDEPLYRGEVAMHAVYGAMARQLGLLTLGTFHERNGDQQLTGAGGRERAWARVFGQRMEQSHSGQVRPTTEGDYYGIQGGIDAIRSVSATGHQDRAGLFAAYANASVDVSGHILATPNLHVGRTDLDATSFGGYWSHLAPTGWYTDAVIMATAYDGDGGTFHGSKVGVSGTGAIASVEGGFPLLKLWGMTLQQQAQLVYQYLNLDEANDPISHVAHDTPDALHGRIGWRLSADGLPWLFKPFLKANLWQDFAGKDSAIYAHTREIVNRHRSTTLELGGGFVATIAPNVGLWASADYATDIGGTEQQREAVRGTAGLRITW